MNSQKITSLEVEIDGTGTYLVKCRLQGQIVEKDVTVRLSDVQPFAANFTDRHPAWTGWGHMPAAAITHMLTRMGLNLQD